MGSLFFCSMGLLLPYPDGTGGLDPRSGVFHRNGDTPLLERFQIAVLIDGHYIFIAAGKDQFSIIGIGMATVRVAEKKGERETEEMK